MVEFDTDYVGSDDMDGIMEQIHNQTSRHNGNASTSTAQQNSNFNEEKRRLRTAADRLDHEIETVARDIEGLQKLMKDLVQQRNGLNDEIAALDATRYEARPLGVGGQGMIDYSAHFDWYDALRAKMREVFGISNFRLCQEGVVNAAMDGRDVVCVMPTGGGKSLTYQLPAVMADGCTVVISPLISLMTDQILHLQEAKVKAVMFSGSVPNRQFDCLTNSSPEDEIKLCYVTPEKINKNKQLMGKLHQLYEDDRLARFVIDEAHCLSQMGHDFRPDYRLLSSLRQLFPGVPITCVSATCPPRVLQDLTETLALNATTDGKNANRTGTVYFSAPLYRPNLHYRILPKPGEKLLVIGSIHDWIATHHKGKSGIIYCLSRNEAEDVAKLLEAKSDGTIKTGIYHADIDDKDKHNLHVRWREGEVNVICATIAFGLGIDKGDVRFVIHHAMPKSLDGFYQESGRAGRDGKDADCLLYYRPMDAASQSSMVYNTKSGKEKLHAMVQFAQDLVNCRKVAFAKYFSSTSEVNLSAWSEDGSGALERCGHCDNCLRPPESFEKRDVTLHAWQILTVLKEVKEAGGKQTVNQFAELVRGNNKARFVASKKGPGRRKMSNEQTLDLDTLIGGKMTMVKEDVERLIIHLLLEKYISEDHVPTNYQVTTYLATSVLTARFTRFTRAQVEEGECTRMEYIFPVHQKKPRASAAKSSAKKPAAKKSADVAKLPSTAASSSSARQDNHANETAGEDGRKQSRAFTSSSSAPTTKRNGKGKEKETIVISDNDDETRMRRAEPICVPGSDAEDVADLPGGHSDEYVPHAKTKKGRKRSWPGGRDSENDTLPDQDELGGRARSKKRVMSKRPSLPFMDVSSADENDWTTLVSGNAANRKAKSTGKNNKNRYVSSDVEIILSS